MAQALLGGFGGERAPPEWNGDPHREERNCNVLKVVLPKGSLERATLALFEAAELRVSTEFPNLTKRYFSELGLPARIFPSYGATEAKVPEIVDAVVDLTETGSTLRSHGMVVIDTLLTSYTEVVANTESAADPERRQAMDDLVTLLVGAITARSKTLVKLNVADAHLPEVLRVLPAMKAPTVTALADSGYHAVEAVVDKDGVNRLITTLKAAGAFDILELPIAKIVL